MITINELFSGIGAQVAALKRLGIEYETVGIAEIDHFAIQSYEAINGETRPHCHRDTGFPIITSEVLYADKRCPFCGEVVVYAHMITC